MKVNVLGTEYEIVKKKYDEDEAFKKRSLCGYCDYYSRKLVICDTKTLEGYEDETEEYCAAFEKEILRHELIHAFLFESGLNESSTEISGGWARNEEMIDFFAIQFPKIAKVFEELKII